MQNSDNQPLLPMEPAKISLPDKLIGIAHYHHAPGSQPTPHSIGDGYEIVELLTGGRGWVWHEEKWVEVIPGTLLWHFAGDQTIGRSDLENPYRCLAVRMEGAILSHRRVPRISFWNDFEAARDLTKETVQCLWTTLLISRCFCSMCLASFFFRPYAIITEEMLPLCPSI